MDIQVRGIFGRETAPLDADLFNVTISAPCSVSDQTKQRTVGSGNADPQTGRNGSFGSERKHHPGISVLSMPGLVKFEF